ncbi:MAG: hypothetical protein FD174_2549 [Geobacteraceae bacterium]|nr:MAG: hypothetical protein FD174_2549 [Geobacteraceae bacterium]
MKKIALLTAALVMTSTMAFAAADTIVGSAHDLKGTYGGINQGSTELCVYCHTPHNAVKDIPLWNRKNPTATDFQLYKSSITLTDEAKLAAFGTDSVSLFCMSCHDGVTKLGAFINDPALANGTTHTASGSALAATNYANLGTNLKNDHPVGFSYAVAVGQDSLSGTGGLRTITEVKTRFGISNSGAYAPFFAGNGKTDTMECASCHKVHMPGTSGNFLRIENTGSNLCLACHAK